MKRSLSHEGTTKKTKKRPKEWVVYGDHQFSGEIANDLPIKGTLKYKNEDEYDGEFKDGIPHGQGVMMYSDLNALYRRFDGEWKDGQFVKGAMEYRNSDIYDGEYVQGKPNGHGVIMFGETRQEFRRFEGQWKDGRTYGKCIMEYRNGDVYHGEWANGKPNGHGVMIRSKTNTIFKQFDGEWRVGVPFKGAMEYRNGAVYDGEFDKGLPHGKGFKTYGNTNKIFKRFDGEWKNAYPSEGVMEYHNGDVYDGELDKGLPHGKGVNTYSKTDLGLVFKRFVGDFHKGLPHGKGVMECRNGDMYDGELDKGLPHGKGVMVFGKAETYLKRFDGEWKLYHHLKGVMEYRNGDVYDGEFDKLGNQVDGIMTYDNGDVYDGEWEEDEKNGEGVMNYANGDVYEGEWKDDQFHGLGHYKYKTEGNKTKEYEGHFERGNRHGRGRMIFDGAEEPYRMWVHNEVMSNVHRTGLAYEVHNATSKVNLEKYLEIIRDAPPLVNNVQDTFETFMRDHQFPDESFTKLTAILIKILPFTDLEEKTWAFVFSQPDKFVKFYIRSFIQDCYHAYDSEDGMSCAKGIRERTYMIVGDAAFALCADKYHCDNPLYLKLNKVFHKHININEFAQEWTSQISPELKKSSTVKRVRHFTKFMKAKYQYLNLYTVDVRRQIRKLAEDWHYIFDAETNPEMDFGGGGRRRLRTRRRKSTSFRKTRQHRRKSTPMWSR